MAELQMRICNVSGKPATVFKYCDFANMVAFLQERKKTIKLRFMELQTSGSLGDNGETDRV